MKVMTNIKLSLSDTWWYRWQGGFLQRLTFYLERAI